MIRKGRFLVVMIGVIVMVGGIGVVCDEKIGGKEMMGIRMRMLEENPATEIDQNQKPSESSDNKNQPHAVTPSIQQPQQPNQISLNPETQSPSSSSDILTDPTIQWPQQGKPYHIYSAMNPRLVLDVAKADDGFHDLILYQWQNSPNQQYYFQRAHDNYYHIINVESKQHMKKSQKIILSTGVSKVKFVNSQQNDLLWQLFPAKSNSKNSFYIISSQKLALDLNEGYANNGAEIILYEWSKNDNQVWFLRQNKQQFQPEQFSKQKYEQRLAELLLQVMSVPDSINECITYEEMKKQMTSKNMILPTWISRPKLQKAQLYQMPLQISQSYHHHLNKNKSLKKHNPSSQQAKPQQKTNKDSNKDSAEQQQNESQNYADFKPQKLALQCAKNHVITYIWYGEKEMPEEYQQLLDKCKNNVRVLTQKDFLFYVEKWNILEPIYAIDIDDYIIRQRINLLKLLYLFFQSGIYADFDTQINEQCFENVFADEIIWTSRLDEDIKDEIVLPLQQIIVPQESFMMITTKEHPQVKRMLQQQIMEHNQRGGQRWKECSFRQCLIIQCSRHYRDNTYKKGFD